MCAVGVSRVTNRPQDHLVAVARVAGHQGTCKEVALGSADTYELQFHA